MLTDCSSIQGSTASSSSDVMTLTTASSWCAMTVPASVSTRVRVLRLIRPHSRRILVAPDTNPSFGFALRGGKEFGTGFFVSGVERNSEAELKGMRVGDQILRINGFRVDDAIHKELVQIISSQDRITLKVRSVGMLPTREKDNDRLTWHVVKTTSVSNTPSEHSFTVNTIEREMRSKDINIVLNVAPRTKLGLGICKGPEWKPGIFVQFTKEKSAARESGLRPGDQILSVNSIDFSDVLFSEAVAVMKSSNKLEMVVRTAAGCDLFPGESSGYNSSASSVTGDQSPCWADIKSKRLTAVREEPMATCWNENIYGSRAQLEGALGYTPEKQQVNKTIIKLSENGTSINNTYITNANATKTAGLKPLEQGIVNVPPPPPPTKTQPDVCYQNETVVVEVHRNGLDEVQRQQSQSQTPKQQQETLQSTIPRKMVTLQAKSSCNHHTRPLDSTLKAPEFNKYMRSAPNNTENGRCGNNDSSNNKSFDSSTLSSAITEELKKRKEKQRMNAAMSNNENGNQHKYIHDRQEQQQAVDAAIRQPLFSTSSLIARSASSNVANCSERNLSGAVGVGIAGGVGVGVNSSTVDQHSALMDEFKRAHQRMFKNGFQESERKERQDALKNTEMMEDEVNHRASRFFTPNGNHKLATNRNENVQSGQQLHIPPPPPQFANSPPKSNQVTNNNKISPLTTTTVTKTTKASTTGATLVLKPPSSPVPDYDNVEVRTHHGARPSSAYGSVTLTGNVRESINATSNRRTMRLGTVTIGEYEQQQRKEPAKFDFISTQKRNNINGNSSGSSNHSHSGNGVESLQSELQNTLTRSNLKKSNNNNNDAMLEHQSDCPLRHNYESTNYENVTRKLQTTSLGGKAMMPAKGSATVITSATTTAAAAAQRNGTSTNGILKNGNRSSGANFSKNTDKTITFGN